MTSALSSSELAELQSAFRDMTNYDSEDPCDPIDPLTYRRPDGDTCLHIAAHRGNRRAVELLLKAGLDVDDRGDMGCTALHYAEYAKARDVVALLLAYGASREIRNEFGKLPGG
jgi:ankyrin repeat protein